MSAAFNEVLKLLTCDYSVTVDADMVLDPTCPGNAVQRHQLV